MKKHFPEIELFFKNASFSKEELDFFIDSVNDMYIELDLNKKAHTLIKLELLKYQLTEQETSTKSKPFGTNSPFNKKLNHVVSKKSVNGKKNKRNPFKNQNEWIQNKLIEMRCMSIDQISSSLSVRPQLIQSLLSQTGKSFIQTDILPDDGFESIIEYAKNRLKIIYRASNKINIEQNKIKQNKRNSNTLGNTVYSALQLHGPGKLIYIRSK